MSDNQSPPYKLTDKDPMPWGKYKGLPMSEVPDSYLLWLYHEGHASGNVGRYLAENIKAIKANVEREKQQKRK